MLRIVLHNQKLCLSLSVTNWPSKKTTIMMRRDPTLLKKLNTNEIKQPKLHEKSTPHFNYLHMIHVIMPSSFSLLFFYTYRGMGRTAAQKPKRVM
jgi:hypothetical protein